MSADRRGAMGREIAYARTRHDNHLSTLHQLVALILVRGSASRQVLANLGIPDAKTIKRAAEVVDGECEQMHRQMLTLACDDRRLQGELSKMFPGSTRMLRRKLKKLQRTAPAPSDA